METYGTATETETEYFGGKPNARAGEYSYTLLNLYAGYQINDNYRIRAGVNNATDLEYIATRHPWSKSRSTINCIYKSLCKLLDRFLGNKI